MRWICQTFVYSWWERNRFGDEKILSSKSLWIGKVLLAIRFNELLKSQMV